MAEAEKLLHRVGSAVAGENPRGRRRPRLRMAAQIGLAAVVIGFLVAAVAGEWSELRDRDVHFELAWLLSAGVILVAVHSLAALAWDLVLRALGYQLAFVRAQMIWGQSLLARYVPGSVFMVVGRVLLAEREGVPRRTTLASTAYEQGIELAAAIIIGICALLASEQIGNETARTALIALPPLLIVAMHPRIFGPIANRTLKAFGRQPLEALMPVGRVIALMFLCTGIWILYGVGAFLVGQSVFDLSSSQLGPVIAAQSLGYAASVMTVVFPAGLGVRDGAFALVLAASVPGGFPVAAAIAIAVRLVSTLSELIFVGAATLLARHRGASPTAGQSFRAST